jgi:hypothetical protein
MYDREIYTKAERREDADYRAACLEDEARTLLAGMFGEEFKRWREWPDTMRVVVDGFTSRMCKLVRARDYTDSLRDGVATRHGTHNRIAKLRCGERQDEYGESMTRWFVVDVPEGWLDHVRARAAESAAEYDQFGYAAQEYVEEKLTELTQDEFGFDVGSTHNTADYSPTGRWFSSVYARQQGTRLLVEENHSLDC